MVEENQRAKWERTRSKGIWRFAIWWGVIMTSAFFLAVTMFDLVDGTPFTLKRAAIRVGIFAMFGIGSGLVLWYITESRYRKGA